MATNLLKRHELIVEQYSHNLDLVHEVQESAQEQLVPSLVQELTLDEAGVALVKRFLRDPVTVFRFCRRAKFAAPAAIKLLHATLLWRLTNPPSDISAIAPIYLTRPLFFFHPDLFDRFGRPCAILNLRHVARTEDGQLEALKELIRFGWEIGRRWLTDLSGPSQAGPKLQMVVIVDMAGSGMSNLEVELLPFFMDLLKNHFPGMVGAIFVLNYNWLHGGMWQLAKRVLPNTALERIAFPNNEELLQFFDPSHLLIEHGGTIQYEYNPSNPIFLKYGRPNSSAYPSPRPSRQHSIESLGDMYHSAPGTPPLGSRAGTPGSLSRKPSGLGMTTLTSSSSGKQGPWEDRILRRVTSLAELQDRLAETQAAIESDSSDFGDSYDERQEGAETEAGSVVEVGSNAPSRSSSRNASRAASREGSPHRYGEGSFSHRANRFSALNHVSPYNFSNPYFGYPAFVPPSHLDPTGVPRPHYHRKRKRDLFRTLTYLFVLRFLALHRNIKARLASLTSLKPSERKPTPSKVHWREDAAAPLKSKTSERKVVDIRLVYLLLAIIFLRSPKCLRLLRLLLITVPAKLLPEPIKAGGTRLVQSIPLPARSGRKRDAVMNLLGLNEGGKPRELMKRWSALSP